VIGILALQGDYHKHIEKFRLLGASAREVRTADELEGLSGLIIPGGESTTMTKLLLPSLRQAIMDLAGKSPVWGTCAGMIMMAHENGDARVKPLSLIDLDVDRNGFGRQTHSFEADLTVGADVGRPEEPLKGIFIRAPRVSKFSDKVQPLVWLADEPVGLRQGNCLVTSFHPELTADDRLHRYFLSMMR
jgi:5'-phosphate synthase pdxT subunit